MIPAAEFESAARLLGPYWTATREALAPLGAHLLDEGQAFARREGTGGAVLEYIDARVPGLGDARATLIHSPRAEIFNAMVFPDDAEALPVFAAEWVAFAGRVHVAVADLQPVVETRSADEARARAEAVLARFPTIEQSDDRPDWCRDYFTPGALFARGCQENGVLLDAYAAYLREFLAMAGSVPIRGRRTGGAAVDAYKLHHVENTPGLAYLSRFFGADWTHDFLRRGMYRPSAGVDDEARQAA